MKAGYQIPLSNNRGYTLVSGDDFEELSKYKWHLTSQGYVARTPTPTTKVLMHSQIMGRTMIDHINRNKLDNRRSNLRFCTVSQNQANTTGRGGTSKYKGVHLADKWWKAQIKKDGKKIYIGKYTDEKEAARAYNIKALELHGEFAYINEGI